MTEALYLEDSTLRSCEATVERVLDDRVVLDRTVCYPEGGGQPADHGRLVGGDDAWAITDVQKQDTIYHHLGPAGDGAGSATGDTEAVDAAGDDAEVSAALREGDTVTVELDWERRYGNMRHHTAQHLLSRVLVDEYDAPTRGNQVHPDRARIDCEQDRFDEADLEAIERRVNELIDDDRGVEWYELDRETAETELDPERTRIELLPDSITEIRIVEIEDFDKTACAGTHVEGTGECGSFELTGRESKGGDVERLHFELGE